MQAELEFVEYGKNDLKGYTLIEGYPGMGLVGTIAAKYLVEKLRFEEIGYVDSNIFAPVIRIHNAVPVRPARIYADRANKVAVLTSEQVIPRQFTHLVAKKTVEWIEAKGIRELISLSGVESLGEKGEMIYGIAANESSRELLAKYSLKEIPEGITTGVTALILLGLHESKVKAVSMLANVQLSADYKATAEVLRKLNEVLGLNLNVEPLMEEARQLERQLVEQMQRLKETRDNAEKFEHKTPLVT